MTHHILLEIGLEEMPAHIVSPSQQQLAERTKDFLQKNHLSFGEVQAFSTPRRLAVLIREVADKQEDEKVIAKGPAKRIAMNEDGEWTKAAQGFVRGQGMTTEDIFFKDIKGVEYVHVEKFVPGKTAMEVLKGLNEVITAMTFPVSMHWADYTFKYIRPIHWIVALMDDQIIPFSVLDIQTGNQSRGHRFLGHEVTIEHALDYEEALKGEYVIADETERKKMIVSQIHAIATENNWVVDIDADLLEEVANLIEYPTAFYGNFDAQYLTIPKEVLITSMRDHQRYFYVKDQQDQLLPYFISVRNGNSQFIENVAKGNEKVLVARLDDAMFFYNEDKNLTINSCVERLKQVTFHEKIGSMYEKMQRVQRASQVIGEKVGLSAEEMADLDRAAQIYKFDLVTNMVDEFPELQGIMGEKYALLQGEKPAVAQAIREHYMPTSSDGELPESSVGTVLAIADKLDSIFSLFAAGLIPTGSNDPFALRRQAFGVIRMIVDKNWSFQLRTVFSEIVSSLPSTDTNLLEKYQERQEDILGFMKGRIRQLLSNKQLRYDAMDAALGSTQQDVLTIIDTAQTLEKHLSDSVFKSTIESVSRILNLAIKANEEDANVGEKPIHTDLFEKPSEWALYEKFKELEEAFPTLSTEEKFHALTALRPTIDTFFDENMVMADDAAIRSNRLAMLAAISQLVLSFANVKDLVVK